MYILVAGGGKVGLHLIRTLLRQGHEIGLVEQDRRVCSLVVEELNEVIVIHGDATSPENLARAGGYHSDVVVAAAGRDQDNYMICKVAKELFNVKRAVARVNDPRNEELFRISGVDFIISVTSMVSQAIEAEIVPHAMMTLFTWHERMSMVEVDLEETSPVVGMPIRKLDFPTGSILAAIWRKGEPVIPDGNTVLLAGDEIFAVSVKGTEDQLKRALLG
ncbi:MAG: NAD-binding protein [Candidatus Sericytochromatia bacterium]|uniref:Trk system potassium uptake protein TrkA n=1 Tax=Candidatus Tanganyikabacteria bacterium TaxID=2961651 RepID=A0A937X3Q5_9BACT|nr:NAD-binding protein [Candidatus Tanganyikabacteria bacterium]